MPACTRYPNHSAIRRKRAPHKIFVPYTCSQVYVREPRPVGTTAGKIATYLPLTRIILASYDGLPCGIPEIGASNEIS
jgi:hypothetical protein